MKQYGPRITTLRSTILLTVLYGRFDCHDIFAKPSLLNSFSTSGRLVTFAYISPVELKVKFSRDYLHLITTNSTNQVLIQ